MSEDAAENPSAEGLPWSIFAVVFLTLFLSLMGFGIILPVLPFYAQSFGASAMAVTLMSTVFSAAQLAMSPVLGRLSDRHGRRVVMLISIGGSGVAMLVLGFAQSLAMVFLARVVSGMCTANVSTAQAIIADRVSDEDRARMMGRMGAAIGLGFIFGPAVGGLLSDPQLPTLPFFVAAGLSAVNFVLAYVLLPDTRSATSRDDKPSPSVWNAAPRVIANPVTGILVLGYFGFMLAFSSMESTFALLLEAKHDYGARETGMVFTGIGVVIVVAQAVVVGKLVSAVGEKRTLLVGMTVLAIGLGLLGAPMIAVVIVGAAGVALGNGLVTPNLSALMSRSSSADEQGFNLGVAQSASSLGRIIGPVVAGLLFERVSPGTPMLTSAVAMLVLAGVLAAFLRAPDRPQRVDERDEGDADEGLSPSGAR